MKKDWMTNDNAAASLLRAADAAYDRAMQKAEALPLAQKVVAMSAARQIRDAAYKVASQ